MRLLSAIAFLRNLLQDAGVLRRPDGKRVNLIVTSINPELFTCIGKWLPKSNGTLHFLDYTAHRVSVNAHYLDSLPANGGGPEI